MTALASKSGSTARRQNMPSPIDREELGDGRDVERRARCGPRPAAAEQLLEALDDVAVDALEDLADARVARRLQADLDAHAAACARAPRRNTARPAPRSACMKSGAAASAAKRSANSARSRSADAGDQRLLAVEIDVERAGADRRLLADVVHGGAVEARRGRSTLGRVEDVLAPGALDIWLELGHCPVPVPARGTVPPPAPP